MYYIIGAVIIYMIIRKITEPKVEHINQEQLNSIKKDKHTHFIDVRTPGEFNSNRIKGFKNVPLQNIMKLKEQCAPEDRIVLICATGSRSMAAARRLNKLGFKHLINVKGGLSRMT